METYEFVVQVQALLANIGQGRRLLNTSIVVPRERNQTADAVKWAIREHAPSDVWVTVQEASGRYAWIVKLEGSFDSLVQCLYAVLTNHEKEMRTNRFG